MLSPAGVVSLVQAAPTRRHKCAAAALAAKANATVGTLLTRSTASRAKLPAGQDGRATAAKLFPALVDTKRPSTNAARISTAPPLGWTLMSQHFPARFKLHATPLLADL